LQSTYAPYGANTTLDAVNGFDYRAPKLLSADMCLITR